MFVIKDQAADALAKLLRCDLDAALEGCGGHEGPAIADGMVGVEGEELFEIRSTHKSRCAPFLGCDNSDLQPKNVLGQPKTSATFSSRCSATGRAKQCLRCCGL